MPSRQAFSRAPELLLSPQQKVTDNITVTITGFYCFLWLLGAGGF